jgi:thioredoxin reductase (NADPH)
MAETYDIVIIGGGAAGFTAGIYAARDRCRALLLERIAAGGQVLNCEHIENYPGFPDGVAGYTLGPLLQQQAMKLGLDVRLADVEAMHLEDGLKVLQTGDGEVRAQALIIATGSSFTQLGVPGEETFFGRGVSHCAACDGAMFMEQPVAVIGGGDAALDEALYLAQYVSQVTIVHRRDTLRACRLLQERAQAHEKLTFRWNTIVRAIEGENVVQRLQVEDVKTGERLALDVAGVFPYLGLTPNTQFLNGLIPLNARGQIVTDLWMRTAVPGVLAAGDVRGDSARQLISAAGDGATAGLAAVHYVRTGQWREGGVEAL